MIIKGLVEYNNNGALTEKRFEFDTTSKSAKPDYDICDAIAFTVYGKTIYQNIINPDLGVPFISINLECNGKIANVVRQPEYLRRTAFGTTYLTKEIFSIETENTEYNSLSCEKYYELLKEYVDISFDEFVSIFKS